jgi:glycosyltransferase involved in cell wall biosynthesis
MHIGLSTSVIQRGRTGVAQYVFGLVRALLAHCQEHRFTLFVLEEDRPLFDFAKREMQIVPVSEKHRRAIKNILWHQLALPRLAKAHKLEALHIPSYRRMLWSHPCTMIATIHDLAPFTVPGKYDWKRMFYGRVVARRLAHRQDAIIAISDNTARDISRFFGIPAPHVKVVYNGIDHTRFCPGSRDDAKAAAAQGHGLDRPFFLYLARIEHPGKNHLRLISAFEAFKAATKSDWLLVFAGSDWHGAEVVHAAASRSPFAADIRSLGFVADELLPSLYRAADAFVYPSLYEGFGLPPIEAMACACPVVCSDRGSLGEVVGTAALIVDPEEPHAITRELYRVATDGSLRNQLRAAGLAQAQKFHWANTALQTLEVYKSAARAGAQRPAIPASA